MVEVTQIDWVESFIGLASGLSLLGSTKVCLILDDKGEINGGYKRSSLFINIVNILW